MKKINIVTSDSIVYGVSFVYVFLHWSTNRDKDLIKTLG